MGNRKASWLIAVCGFKGRENFPIRIEREIFRRAAERQTLDAPTLAIIRSAGIVSHNQPKGEKR